MVFIIVKGWKNNIRSGTQASRTYCYTFETGKWFILAKKKKSVAWQIV